ncbi:MAG: MGMT family protein [Deltaproteobacteria bacterium]|nr:MGMT family protein [Deltaproteobacteria bacterium]
MPTEFAGRVYRALAEVPAGMVTTYKLLAAAVGCRSCQAVGQALRRNPFAPQVPCHRVIKSDLSLGGFMGECGGAARQRKIALLRREGVIFKGGRLLDSKRIYVFSHWRP